jgi:hypothetical protein
VRRRLTEGLVHRVLDRRRTELGASRAQSHFVEVNEVLRHPRSIYAVCVVYLPLRPGPRHAIAPVREGARPAAAGRPRGASSSTSAAQPFGRDPGPTRTSAARGNDERCPLGVTERIRWVADGLIPSAVARSADKLLTGRSAVRPRHAGTYTDIREDLHGYPCRSRWVRKRDRRRLLGTCYTGTDEITAVMEAFGDLPVITQGAIDARAMASIQISRTQRLADMTSPTIVGQWRLDRRLSVGHDYAVCQRWAHSLRPAGFSGIYYEPRHDPRGNHFASIAMFADPGHQPRQMTVIADDRIRPSVVEATQQIFRMRVLPAAELPPA